jgi:tetratricopeptide (TPR) repeat protein
MELGMAAMSATTDPASPGREVRGRGGHGKSRPGPALFLVDPKGVSSERDSDVARRCDRALALMLAHRGNPGVEIDSILADHPRSVFGHCLRAALIVRNDDHAARPILAASIAAIAAAGRAADDPARRHAAAASAWLEGHPALALERYAAIAVARPRDSLAIAVAHALDFRLGNRRMLRDRLAGVVEAWDASMSHYPAILAMYAFGLEENGAFRKAERLAHQALAIDPGHPPAIHVLAHVMEMEGRAREGLVFLAEREAAWLEGTDLSVHLAWHRALFHLQINEPDSALIVYDRQIASATGPDMASLADASALLWRLKLLDLALGDRWKTLAERWEIAPLLGARPFYIVHAIMAFAASGRAPAVARLLETVPHIDIGEGICDPAGDALVHPVANALVAFAAGDYHTSAAWLERVRDIASRCGGSLAQCDVVQLTFAEAALRAERASRKTRSGRDSSIRDPAAGFASSTSVAARR